jgi:hypothetical protein
LSRFDKIEYIHTHTHLLLEDKPFSILLNLTHLRLSNNTKGMSNDVLKRYDKALPLEVSLYANLFFEGEI